jgi:hypothetical protein
MTLSSSARPVKSHAPWPNAKQFRSTSCESLRDRSSSAVNKFGPGPQDWRRRIVLSSAVLTRCGHRGCRLIEWPTSPREQALRNLPLAYSLALRLRDAGVAPAVICEYINVEEASLEGLYRIAEAKLAAALDLCRAPDERP